MVTQRDGSTKTMAILPLKSYPRRALALSVLEEFVPQPQMIHMGVKDYQGVDVIWGPPRCVWARESTAPAQGNLTVGTRRQGTAPTPGGVEQSPQ